MLHRLIGRHTPDPDGNRWEAGRFVSACLSCGRRMEKPPGGAWRLAKAPSAA